MAMRRFRLIALTASLVAWAATPALPQTCACPPVSDDGDAPAVGPVHVAVYADEPPPPLPVYQQPPLPEPGYVWTPGYWAWNGYEHYWAPGVWVEPPRVGVLWTPGYWAFVDGVYLFHQGYWGEHVGFYGGVNYGFGYGGAGYGGGRWDNGQFFYNRSVNNVRNVRVTNVYEEKVTVNNVTINRISYNGPNGVTAKPTPAELAVAKEPHVAETAAQAHNVRVASRTESAFVSENKGKPPVAATAKPGVFKGPAVVHAEAAGGPLPVKPEPGAGEAAPGRKSIEPAAPARPEKRDEFKANAKAPEDATPAPTKSEPPATEPAKAEPGKQPEHRKSEPLKSEAPKPEPAKPEPAKPEPTKPGPANAEPAIRKEERRQEPKLEAPKPPKVEAQRPAAPRPGAACGHPGQPECTK
jgi:hypothetical protein